MVARQSSLIDVQAKQRLMKEDNWAQNKKKNTILQRSKFPIYAAIVTVVS